MGKELRFEMVNSCEVYGKVEIGYVGYDIEYSSLINIQQLLQHKFKKYQSF